MKAFLILEDGTVFSGESIGSQREIVSEIVFNTSMTGYLEVLTDPSYAGQAVVMTYPLIGNYGITPDMESPRAWPDGYIVRELSRTYSNFRSVGSIQDFLREQDIPGVAGVDTRALTRLLREKGTMNGMITVNEDYDLAEILPKLRSYRVGDVVSRTTCREKSVFPGQEKSLLPGCEKTLLSGYEKTLPLGREKALLPGYEKTLPLGREKALLPGTGKRVALLDLGAKRNIADSLHRRGCEVVIYPAHTMAEEILADGADGIMLSNGPGDPKDCGAIISEIRKLADSAVPIFAICLGHQLMALANGMDTYKLKYGHRGGNHPVKDLSTGKVYISSQNHGYAVDTGKLDPAVAVPAFVNVNDGTNEGLRYMGKNIFTVQFHPEACPGPEDTGFLFDRFLMMMEDGAEMGADMEARTEAVRKAGADMEARTEAVRKAGADMEARTEAVRKAGTDMEARTEAEKGGE